MNGNVPVLQMHLLVVGRAQQAAVFYAGLTAVDPILHVVRGADSRWSITARESTSAIPGDECAADAQGYGAHGSADVARLGLAAHDHWDQLAITSQAAGIAGTDQLAIVQSGGAEPGA